MHSTLRQALHSLYWGQPFWVVEGEFCVLISIFPQNYSNNNNHYCAKSSTFAPCLRVAYATQGYAAHRYSSNSIIYYKLKNKTS